MQKDTREQQKIAHTRNKMMSPTIYQNRFEETEQKEKYLFNVQLLIDLLVDEAASSPHK
jgi:hypothetical protein